MTRVALLWHMHQPFYQDLATGEHILPWVRLHALKDYYGMAALTREFPSLKVTFNLVPSLLVQLEAFAAGQARDRHLEVGLVPADQLRESDRQFCAEQFFHAHRARMIDPFPRYAELFATREAGRRRGNAAAGFTSDDLRDLQVWHKLVWIDPIYADRDSRVRALFAKGRDFSELDKQTLRAVELEILGRVVGEYREAAERGQVEISASPFYHPILPLLCDASVFLRTNPSWPPPEQPFVYPEDASEQLRRAVALHQRAELGHRDLLVAADVDPAQERDEDCQVVIPVGAALSEQPVQFRRSAAPMIRDRNATAIPMAEFGVGCSTRTTRPLR